MKRDYYEILGVGRDAGGQELKSAYRRLAIQFHPDKNAEPEASEKFKEASEAYAVLSDPDKRQRYDRFGHEGVRGSGGFDPSGFGDFSDLFGQIFGSGFGGFGRSGAPSGEDLVSRLEITFEQAAFGTEQEVTADRLERCTVCAGSGAQEGTRPVTCATCQGRGQVRFSQGFFTMARTCPACRGEGTKIEKPCAAWGVVGRSPARGTITVNIPGGS
jgi:molecular chaperone DnaJ